MTDIKFCGMTRAEDAHAAAVLGAAYVGVIFASGPRRVSVDQAAHVLDGLPASVRRVGVFGDSSADEIIECARRLELGVVQLHGGGDDVTISRIRGGFKGLVWRVLRIGNGDIPHGADEFFASADAVLLDARVEGKLGGTGVALPWRQLADELKLVRARGRAELVLAGGLRPENVSEAIRLLRPEIVDVSSGVETAPGIKDHARMRAFRDAVHAST